MTKTSATPSGGVQVRYTGDANTDDQNAAIAVL